MKSNGLFAVAGLMVFSIIMPAHANASNFSGATGSRGCTGGVNMQDNSTMTYSRQSLTSGNDLAVGWVLNNDVVPTDIALAAEMATPDSNTDVIYNDYDYWNYCGYAWHGGLGTVVGLMVCVSLSGSRCNQAEVDLDTSFTDITTPGYRQALACHETGHTLGLTHNPNNLSSTYGCMPASLESQFIYSPHDLSHINSNY